ncbi:MAG: F0F1 ATP synthase subunit delta [Syntrophobacteria bacterium]
MLIDWFTVAAQIVNFLILIGLLKHFLYDRIIAAMDEREKKISSRLEEADTKRKEAEEEAESYRRKNREFEEQRQQMLSEAKKKAETRRKELLQEVRQEVEALRNKWHQSIQREKETFLRDLRRLVGGETLAITRRAVGDLVDVEVGRKAVEVFLRRIRQMKEKERQEITAALEQGSNQATVVSGFELQEAVRQEVTEALQKHLLAEIEPTYETDPELILGIELRTQGRKIAWSLQDYLGDFEGKILAALDQHAGQSRE